MSSHDNYPSSGHELEQSTIARLKAAAEARSLSSTGRLDPQSGRHDYDGQTLTHPLVSHERYSGTLEEGLTHLVLVGDFTLAVSRGFNRKRVGGIGTPIESVRVSVLPIGDHPAANKKSAVTLFEVRPRELNNPRQNGVVQAWESVKIGRGTLAEATGMSDDSVSRQHLEFTVHNDGSFRIHDTSSNGTQVLSESDLIKQEAGGGLSDSGKHDLAQIMQELQQNEWEWTEQSAGITVITDAQ